MTVDIETEKAPPTQGALLAFSRDRRGSIATMFALMLVPALLMVGLAIDLSQAEATKARFQSAADAAVLAALTEENPAARPEVARQVFMSNVGAADRDKISDFIYRPGQNGSSSGATVDYVFRQDALSASLFNLPDWKLAGTSQADGGITSKQIPFDVEFWLDVSASMAVGIDKAARDELINLSSRDRMNSKCVFACHMRRVDWTKDGITKSGTTYDRALDYGVKIRFTVMKDTVRAIARELIDGRSAGSFSIGIFRERFKYVSQAIKTAAQLDSALDGVWFQMDTDQPDRDGLGSKLDEALTNGAQLVAPASKPSFGKTPAKMVIIITDGFQYRNNPNGPIDPSVCTGIKNKGITVSVIEMPYVDPYENQSILNEFRYSRMSTDLTPVKNALEQCASPGYFFSAIDADDIHAAFDAMVANNITKKGLTITR